LQGDFFTEDAKKFMGDGEAGELLLLTEYVYPCARLGEHLLLLLVLVSFAS